MMCSGAGSVAGSNLRREFTLLGLRVAEPSTWCHETPSPCLSPRRNMVSGMSRLIAGMNCQCSKIFSALLRMNCQCDRMSGAIDGMHCAWSKIVCTHRKMSCTRHRMSCARHEMSCTSRKTDRAWSKIDCTHRETNCQNSKTGCTCLVIVCTRHEMSCTSRWMRCACSKSSFMGGIARGQRRKRKSLRSKHDFADDALG